MISLSVLIPIAVLYRRFQNSWGAGFSCSKDGLCNPVDESQLDKHYQNLLRYSGDSDLSIGGRYSPFKLLGPGGNDTTS